MNKKTFILLYFLFLVNDICFVPDVNAGPIAHNVFQTGNKLFEIGNLPSIRRLILSNQGGGIAWNEGPGLSGPIPPEIGNLTMLYDLDLSRNDLTGGIPPEIGNLPQLENLRINQNRLGCYEFDLSYDFNISSLSNASNYKGGFEISIRYLFINKIFIEPKEYICPDYL